MSSSDTTYLITGATRGKNSPAVCNSAIDRPTFPGIGKGLAASYLLRPKTTVIAAVRDPANDRAKSLHDLPKGQDSHLIIVKIDSASETDAAVAVKDLESTHNIKKVDVVIANAGIGVAFDTATDVRIADLQTHISVNTVGPILLFQAVLPLLQQSSRPVFIVVSSKAGSIGGMQESSFTLASYGASKVMINYLVRKIHLEHKNIIAFPIHPG